MIRALGSLLALTLAVPTSSQAPQDPAFVSPCPNVFTYEPLGTELGKWYGVVNLTADTTLYALWLNIVLDGKADILGNWVGEVTTEDNLDFKIENTKMQINPGPPLSIRFFIQFNAQNPTPKLQAIRFNGREICNVDPSQVLESEIQSPDSYGVPIKTDITTSTTVRPTTTTARSYVRQHTTTTLKPQYWQQTKVENNYQVQQQTTTKSPYWTQTKTEKNYQIKNEDRQQTTLKPNQYWVEAKPENSYQVKTENKVLTTVKPQYWQQVKIDEDNQVKSDDRQLTTLKSHYWTQAKTEEKTTTLRTHVQIKPDDRSQTTSVEKIQSPAQLWSQTKIENNQQVKSKDKQTTIIIDNNQHTKNQERNTEQEEKYQISSKTRTENSSQVAQEVTTQSQLWTQFKVESNQQTRFEDRLQTKNENKSHTTETPSLWPNVKLTDNQRGSDDRQQTRTENKSPAVVEQLVKTQYWPKITAENSYQIKPDRNTATAVNQSPRTETKFEIEDTSYLESSNVQKNPEVTTYVKPESSHQIKPDERFQSKHYDGFQVKPSGSRQEQNEPREDIPVYVRPDDRRTVSDNREQVDSYKKRTEDRQQNRDEGRLGVRPIKRHNDKTEEKPSWSGERTSSWPEPPKDTVGFESAGGSSTYNNDGRIKNFDDSSLPFIHVLTTEKPVPTIYTLPEMADFDNNSPKKDEKVNDYFGGLPTIYIPNHAHHRTEPQCGKVFLNKNNSYRGGGITLEGQWPWQIALYQQQTTVDFKYICGGTLISRRHVVTAAHCITRKMSPRVVNKNTLTVYLGKHNLRTSVEGVQVKFVARIIVHPEYNATILRRDLAILELKEDVLFTDWVQPACLWPDHETDLNSIVGKKGSVVGWGFDVTGTAREELNLIQMPVVDQETCAKSFPRLYRQFTSDRTYCAGYRDGTSICNGDSGGGMVFKQDDSWYLRGLVSLSVARQGEYRCDPNHFVIFTDLAKFLPWIEETIDNY